MNCNLRGSRQDVNFYGVYILMIIDKVRGFFKVEIALALIVHIKKICDSSLDFNTDLKFTQICFYHPHTLAKINA